MKDVLCEIVFRTVPQDGRPLEGLQKAFRPSIEPWWWALGALRSYTFCG